MQHLSHSSLLDLPRLCIRYLVSYYVSNTIILRIISTHIPQYVSQISLNMRRAILESVGRLHQYANPDQSWNTRILEEGRLYMRARVWRNMINICM